jgi:hypothetical protein
MGITYSECVSVALGIQHAMRMHRIVIYGLLGSTKFFRILSHKAPFWKKKVLFLIPHSFDWLAAFHLDLLHSILFIAV